MTWRFWLLVAAVATAAAIALSACSSGSDDGAPFDVPGTPLATTKVMLPKSYRFEPAVITVSVGATVTWTNDDNFPHTVHLLDESDKTIDLPIGKSGSITFETPGTIYYECSIHPQQMHGKVIVKQA